MHQSAERFEVLGIKLKRLGVRRTGLRAVVLADMHHRAQVEHFGLIGIARFQGFQKRSSFVRPFESHVGAQEQGLRAGVAWIDHERLLCVRGGLFCRVTDQMQARQLQRRRQGLRIQLQDLFEFLNGLVTAVARHINLTREKVGGGRIRIVRDGGRHGGNGVVPLLIGQLQVRLQQQRGGVGRRFREHLAQPRLCLRAIAGHGIERGQSHRRLVVGLRLAGDVLQDLPRIVGTLHRDVVAGQRH